MGLSLARSVTIGSPTKWDILRGYDGRILVALSIGWFAIRLGREALPALLPAIIESVDITASTAGFGLTVLWLIYSLSQYPGGRFSDGLTSKTVLVGGIVGVLASFLVLSLITTYAGLLFGFALLGLGAGVYFSPSRAALADLFTSRRGEAFGIMSAAGSIGAAMAAVVAVVALEIGIWQSAFLPVLVALSGALLALHVWQRDEYVVAPVSLEIRPTIGRLVGMIRIRWFIVAYITVSFTWQGFLGFLPTFLQIELGFSPFVAGSLYALVFVIAIIVGPIAGRLADMFSRLLVSVVGLCVSVVGLASMIAIPTVVGTTVGIGLAALGLRTYPPVMQAHIMGLFPEKSVAGDFGGAKMIYTAFGSLAPTYVGVVAARENYTVAFSGFIGVLLLGIAVLGYLYVTEE